MERSAASRGLTSAEMMPCMLCNNANAAIYCYNDNAYLCKTCDGQIHNKNKLAWRHQRSHLCEVCDSAPPKPAVVYCAQDKVRARALCFTAGNVSTALARPRSEIHQRRDETKTARESVFRAGVVGRRSSSATRPSIPASIPATRALATNARSASR